MAKIFRFSGYFVDGDNGTEYENQVFYEEFLGSIIKYVANDCNVYAIQQLHTEESKTFEPNGELDDNCDLALLTRHFKKDNADMQFDRPLPTKGEKYKHFKLGKIVTVIGLSRHTETEEITVVYEYEGHIWNRPLEMFMSEVDRDKYPQAEQKHRFELVESEG